jgi:hypothetical protein
MFGERSPEQLHPFKRNWTAISPIGSGREEEELPAPFAPNGNYLGQAVRRRMVSLIDE